MSRLRIGTRGSPLALWQAETVRSALAAGGCADAEIVVITTTGDRLSRAPISNAGGKRLFVKEIEEALVDGRIDLAVHSAKDLPADRRPGLAIQGVLAREDPRDALVARPTAGGLPTDPIALLKAFGDSARVGTGSIRRAAQLRHAFPNIAVTPVRGNVGTRLRKLDAGNYDLLVLAAAGLVRLDLAGRITARLPIDLCVPAPGQGIVVVEFRRDDDAARSAVTQIGDPSTSAALAAERALVTALGADCQVPLGAISILEKTRDHLTLVGVVASPDGSRLLKRHARGTIEAAVALGTRVAADLLADGAGELLVESDRP